MFFATNGARFGFRATLMPNIGYHIATWIVTAGIGFGFGSLLEFIPNFFEIIRYAGAAYVFYLAWKESQLFFPIGQSITSAASAAGVLDEYASCFQFLHIPQRRVV